MDASMNESESVRSTFPPVVIFGVIVGPASLVAGLLVLAQVIPWPWFLGIPNVLAGVVFLWGTVRIRKRIRNGSLLVGTRSQNSLS
jgi:hypothetical protein